MKLLLLVIIGYLIGSIQPAYLIGKYVGKMDIRNHGSTNAGASNITTIMGWKYGIITGLFDILKALIPVLIVKDLYSNPDYICFFVGFSIIIGHIFPFHMNFKGGKGTASFIGMMFGINLIIGLIIALTIVIVTIVTNYIAIGTIAMITLAPILLFIYNFSVVCILICITFSLLSSYKHFPNVKRIMKHEETGLRSTL